MLYSLVNKFQHTDTYITKLFGVQVPIEPHSVISQKTVILEINIIVFNVTSTEKSWVLNYFRAKKLKTIVVLFTKQLLKI